MKYIVIILLSFFSITAGAQVMQVNNTPGGLQFRALKTDTMQIVPRYTDTSAAPTGWTKWGVSTNGSVIFTTSDTALWVRYNNRWYPVGSGTGGGAGITNISYRPGNVIDTLYFTDSGGDTDWYYVITRDGLISGGIVTYAGADRTYTITEAIYRIGGAFYTAGDTTIVLAALADPDSSRSDVFVADVNGQFTVVQGVESANPLVPQIDPSSQVFLTHVTLTPTNPDAGIDTTIIYDEKFEWVGGNSGMTVNFGGTTTPYRGTYVTDVSAINSGDIIGYGTGTAVNKTSYAGISLYIKLKAAMPNNNNIYVSFFNGTTQVTNEVALPITKSNITSYQGLSLGFDAFTFSNNLFDSVRFRYNGSGISGFYLDFVYLQNGISPVVINPGTDYVQNIRRTGDNIEQQKNGVWSTQFSVSDKLNISDTASMMSNAVRGAYRRAGTDSVFTYDAGGEQFAFRDSIGGGGSTICGNYDFSTTTTASDPGSGNLRLNNATYASVTNIYIDDISSNGTDASNILAAIRSGDVVYIQDQDDASKFFRATASAAATDNAGWWTIPVTFVSSSGTLFANNANLSICLVFGSGGGSGTSGVNYISADSAFVGAVSGPGQNGTDAGTAGFFNKNIFIGPSAGANTTTGRNLIGLGNGALRHNTNGSNNIAIGDSALLSLNGGYSNYAWGAKAGQNTTTGYRNVFFGDSSGRSLVSGYGNLFLGRANGNAIGAATNTVTSIGMNAMVLATNAPSQTVAIGYEAAGNTTSAPGASTLIGYQVGYRATGQMTAVGYQAGYKNTDANTNTFIGHHSGYNNTNGSVNTFVGLGAGFTNSNASRNTAVGYNAGYYNNGQNNVFVGDRAGWQTNSADNVMIGALANYGVNTTGARNITIGSYSYLMSGSNNDQFVLGSGNGTTNRWFISDVSSAHRRWTLNGTTTNLTATTTSVTLDITGTDGGVRFPSLTTTQRNALTASERLTTWNTTVKTHDVYDGIRWVQQPNGLSGSATLDFGSTAAQTSADLTITVTGAADGDIVIVGPVNASTNANSNYTAWVSAANTVTVRFNNYSAAAIDPASGTFKVYVIKN